MKMVKPLFFIPLVICLVLAAANARLLKVYLKEKPLTEVKAFKDVHKEVLMKRGVSNERNVPLANAISKNRDLKLQEGRIKAQQDNFISRLPEPWKVVEIDRENGRKEKAVSHIGSNSVVIDIGDSDVLDATKRLMFMPGVERVEEEHEIKLDTFQSLDQVGATAVYEAFSMDELDIGKGIKIAITDNGNYVNTSMMNDDGFTLPINIPSDRGEESNTNKKLIISRYYGSFKHSYQEKNDKCHGIQ